MFRAVWNGAVLAESDHTVKLEGNHYFPPKSLHREHLSGSPTTSTCPWKGEARYHNVSVDRHDRGSGLAWDACPGTAVRGDHAGGSKPRGGHTDPPAWRAAVGLGSPPAGVLLGHTGLHACAATEQPPGPSGFRLVSQEGVEVRFRAPAGRAPDVLEVGLHGKRDPRVEAYWDGCRIAL